MEQTAAKKRILVIEDEVDTARAVASLLMRAGYEAEIASDGEGALNKARSKNFDLFFLDVHLPGMSGLEVYRSIREILPTAKVCIMTGWPKGFDAQKEEYLSLVCEGAVDKMLRKPFSRDEILDAVKSLLES